MPPTDNGNLFRKLVSRMGVKPSTHGEPFCGLVSVATVLIGKDRFNAVVAKPVKERDKFRWLKKVRDRDV